MNTIMILAEALAKASGLSIDRLDIHYNCISEHYSGTLWLGSDVVEKSFVIFEDGTITQG